MKRGESFFSFFVHLSFAFCRHSSQLVLAFMTASEFLRPLKLHLLYKNRNSFVIQDTSTWSKMLCVGVKGYNRRTYAPRSGYKTGPIRNCGTARRRRNGGGVPGEG